MQKNFNSQNIAELFHCLSLLENKTSTLYQTVIKKTQFSKAKTLLEKLVVDSNKHAKILQELGSKFGKFEADEKACSQKIGESWMVLSILQREIDDMKVIEVDDLPSLSKKLLVLESVLGEEYYMMVQMKTLEMMDKQINQLYHVDLSEMRGIFAKILSEEERHIEILESIHQLLARNQKLDDNPVESFKTLSIESDLIKH
jgi:rubrerythrin